MASDHNIKYNEFIHTQTASDAVIIFYVQNDFVYFLAVVCRKVRNLQELKKIKEAVENATGWV